MRVRCQSISDTGKINLGHEGINADTTNRQEADLIVVTSENVTWHRTVRMLGQCFGVVVRSRGLGGNVMAGLRAIVGGVKLSCALGLILESS
jgi:Putative heavy-metal-binding